MCSTRKIQYSQSAAIEAAARIGHCDLLPYKCAICHRWHIGHARALAGARVDQLLDEARQRDRRAKAKP